MERGSSRPRGLVPPSSEHRDRPPGRSHPSPCRCPQQPPPRPPASCPAPSASGDGRDESPGRVRGSTVGGRGASPMTDRPGPQQLSCVGGPGHLTPKSPPGGLPTSHTGRGSGHTPSGRATASSQRSGPHAAGRPAAPCTPQPGGPQAPPRLSLQVPPSPSCASWAPLPPAMAQGSAEGTQCREDHSAGHQGEFLARAGIQGQRQGLIMAQG